MEILTSDEVYEEYEYDTKTKWVKVDLLIEEIELMKKQSGEEVITDELILRLNKDCQN